MIGDYTDYIVMILSTLVVLVRNMWPLFNVHSSIISSALHAIIRITNCTLLLDDARRCGIRRVNEDHAAQKTPATNSPSWPPARSQGGIFSSLRPLLYFQRPKKNTAPHPQPTTRAHPTDAQTLPCHCHYLCQYHSQW